MLVLFNTNKEPFTWENQESRSRGIIKFPIPAGSTKNPWIGHYDGMNDQMESFINSIPSLEHPSDNGVVSIMEQNIGVNYAKKTFSPFIVQQQSQAQPPHDLFLISLSAKGAVTSDVVYDKCYVISSWDTTKEDFKNMAIVIDMGGMISFVIRSRSAKHYWAIRYTFIARKTEDGKPSVMVQVLESQKNVSDGVVARPLKISRPARVTYAVLVNEDLMPLLQSALRNLDTHYYVNTYNTLDDLISQCNKLKSERYSAVSLFVDPTILPQYAADIQTVSSRFVTPVVFGPRRYYVANGRSLYHYLKGDNNYDPTINKASN